MPLFMNILWHLEGNLGIWRASARNQGSLNFSPGVFKSSSWVGLGLYFHVFNLVGLGLYLYDVVLSLQCTWTGLKKK